MLWMFHIRCSMCPPCCCTTHSRRRRHSLILLSMKLCESCVVLVVFLCSAATQLRWCYRPNYHFVRYKFLVVTVKKLLKSVFSTLSYAYTKITPTFLAHPVCMYVCTYVRTYVRTYVCMYRSRWNLAWKSIQCRGLITLIFKRQIWL